MAAVYDRVADAYDRWMTGDPDAQACYAFYVRTFAHTPGPLLELGAGTSRITSELTGRGVRAVGLDASHPMLESAQGSSPNGSLCVVQGLMESLPFRDGAVDAVICPQRTIGHFVADAGVLGVFAGAWRVLRPGGRFVLDHHGVFPSRLLDRERWFMYEERDAQTGVATMQLWNRYERAAGDRVLHCSVVVEERAPGATERSSHVAMEFDFRWFLRSELEGLAVRAGFEIDGCLGDFSGSPYHAGAPQVIWLLRKPR